MDKDPQTGEPFLPGTLRLFVERDGVLQDGEIILNPPPTSSPNDPLNWSPWRKYWHAFLVLFITGFTAATANDAGAAGDGQLKELGIPYSIENTGAGVLFIGIGYWCLLAAPFPWLYGRRIGYLIGLIFSLIGSIWFGYVQTVEDAIWNQLFVGASESCAEALVQLSLSDLFFQHQRGLVLGLYILATSVGTFLGPLFAGFIAEKEWRWVGFTAACITGATLVVFYFGLEETMFYREHLIGGQDVNQPPQTLATNSSSDDEKYPSENHNEEKHVDDKIVRTHHPEFLTSPNYIGKSETGEPVEPAKSYWQRIALITPAPAMVGFGFKQYFSRLWHLMRIFTFPGVIYSGIQWGAQDAWLTFYLTIEEDNYYHAPWSYGNEAVAIMNIPTLIGAVIGCVYGGWFSDYFVRWVAKKRGGVSEAEDRLWLIYASMFISPAGLMLFGIATGDWEVWSKGQPGAYIGLGLIGFGWGCAGDLSLAYLMDAYPDAILEGMVGVAVINNTMAMVFTFTCSLWLKSQHPVKTFIAIGILSFFFQALTIPMQWYGKRCRRWTLEKYRAFVRDRDSMM